MDVVRTFGMVFLLLTESGTGANGQQSETSPNPLSIPFHMTNYLDAFNQSIDRSVSLANETPCTKLSVDVKLNRRESVIKMRNDGNATLPPHGPGVSFNWRIIFRKRRSVFHAQAYFMCSAVHLWMTEWITWQTRLIRNETILISIATTLPLIEYRIRGSINLTYSGLCFTLKIDGGKIRDEDVQKLLEPKDMGTFKKIINGTKVCFSGMKQDPAGIGNLLSDILSKRKLIQSLLSPTDYTVNQKQTAPSSFVDARVTEDFPLNSSMETTSAASEPHLDSTGFDKLKIAMIVLAISILLLVLVAIYFVFCRNYRRVYRPVARSVETHELNRSDAIRIKQTFV